MDTTLILTTTEAELFKKFMQHRDLFLTMELTGAFDVQYGKVVLNYAGGLLQTVQKEEIVWKR